METTSHYTESDAMTAAAQVAADSVRVIEAATRWASDEPDGFTSERNLLSAVTDLQVSRMMLRTIVVSRRAANALGADVATTSADL